MLSPRCVYLTVQVPLQGNSDMKTSCARGRGRSKASCTGLHGLYQRAAHTTLHDGHDTSTTRAMSMK